MSKKKKKQNDAELAKLALKLTIATAIINLLTALDGLIDKLIK